MLPAFKACLLSAFLQVLARTAESLATRASKCWANHKIVVFTARLSQAQYTTDIICDSECVCSTAFPDYEDLPCSKNRGQAPSCNDAAPRYDRDAAATACPQVQAGGCVEGSVITSVDRIPHQHSDWLSDSDCDDSDSDDSSTDMGCCSGGGNAGPESLRRDLVEGPEEAVALQLLAYTQRAAAAAADDQESDGMTKDMDSVLESLVGLHAAAEEIEEWARSPSL